MGEPIEVTVGILTDRLRFIRWVDGFGLYVSELCIAPKFRGHSHGAALLAKIKEGHPDQDIIDYSDADAILIPMLPDIKNMTKEEKFLT